MPRRNGRPSRRAEMQKVREVDQLIKIVRSETPEQRADRAKASLERGKSKPSRWTRCVVPRCKFQTQRILCDEIEFPICSIHAAAVWQAVEDHDQQPWMGEAVAAIRSRRDVIRAEKRALEAESDAEFREAFKAGTIEGDIYFIRLNGLIKVGWSSDLEARVKSYGASAELICHYPATRQDETTLHRQLRPALAKGREWYYDGDVVGLFVTQALTKYGPPDNFDWLWTKPKQVVAGKRATRQRR